MVLAAEVDCGGVVGGEEVWYSVLIVEARQRQ